MERQNKIKGIVLVMGASSIFGLMPLFARIGINNGLNTITIVMFRSLFAMMILGVYMRQKKMSIRVEKKYWKDLFMVSTFGYGLMVLTLFYSYLYMPTGIATTIHFVYPAVVLLGCVTIYKEKLTIEKLLAVVAALVGIYLLSVDDTGFSLHPWGFFLAFISGVLYAYYILKVSYSTIREMNAYKLVFYISMFNFIYFFITALLTNQLSMQVTWIGYLDMVVLAVCSVLAMAAFKTGLTYITSWSGAILSSFEPVTSIIIGVILFNESFQGRNMAGSLIIIIAVVYIAWIEKKSSAISIQQEAEVVN